MERKQIVVGVLKRGTKVLLSLRQKHQVYADFWEFPGGKVEAGESLLHALEREFEEEVGVKAQHWQPLITIPWDYEHATVMLNVFVCQQFEGEPHGKEGQKIQWVEQTALADFQFPEANQGIVTALALPNVMMITGDFKSLEDGLAKLETALKDGIRLVQLRAKKMEEEDFLEFARLAIETIHRYHGKAIINGKPEWLQRLPEADGLQLASTSIMHWASRPISSHKLLSVSTHSELEVAKALELGADILLLSPVKATTTHPDMNGMGWQIFSDIVQQISVPVFALGGMKESDIQDAIKHGGQGVAAISSFWPSTL